MNAINQYKKTKATTRKKLKKSKENQTYTNFRPNKVS